MKNQINMVGIGVDSVDTTCCDDIVSVLKVNWLIEKQSPVTYKDQPSQRLITPEVAT